MRKRVLSIILAVSLLLTLFSGLPAFAAGETEHTIAVSDSAPAAVTLSVGKNQTIDLNEVFTDSNGDKMTYTLDKEYGDLTYIKDDGIFNFCVSKAGTYDVTITAKCSADESITASYKVSFTVEEAENPGDDKQYGYDETDAESVTVYVTISNDGIPLAGNDDEGTILSHLKVEVPYFDLADYGLEEFYRYGTDGGSGEYTGTEVIQRPTLLHLYLYLMERYYMNLPADQWTKGDSKPMDYDKAANVLYMDGEKAYSSDGKSSLTISGSATHLYMTNFWGHDENLMYYRNHMYPLQSAGWGSTADYILLSDGDTVDLGMFSNWNFYTYGAFACFDKDSYTAKAGENFYFSTMKYDTSAAEDGGAGEMTAIKGLDIAVYDENWKLVDTIESGENDSAFSYKFAKSGTYYLLGTDKNARTNDAAIAPATAIVTVTGGSTSECSHENTETAYVSNGDKTHTVTVTCTDCNKEVSSTKESCVDENSDKKCDLCGGAMNSAPVLKSGVEAVKTDNATVNTPYMLSELEAGSIFEDPDGDRLTATSYYFQRSEDGGETWSDKQNFGENMFGGPVLCFTETKAGEYEYRVYAFDGTDYSEEYWTLKLTVAEAVETVYDVTFYVSRDKNGADNNPTIKLYKTDTDSTGAPVTDANGYDTYSGDMIEPTSVEMDANGQYRVYKYSIKGGWYSYRAADKDGNSLGGMCLSIPTDKNVDGAAAGGCNIYLRVSPIYTSTQKEDGTYFNSDEYYTKVNCPIMKCSPTPGAPYLQGKMTYYPYMLYAGGNASLYNYYVYPKATYEDASSWSFGYMMNQTVSSMYTINNARSVTLNKANAVSITAPTGADVGLYFQWNNFNTVEWEQSAKPYVNAEEGTTTWYYSTTGTGGSWTWRVSYTDPVTGTEYVTKAGWLSSADMKVTFGSGDETNTKTHDHSGLGTQAIKRDDSDIWIGSSNTGAVYDVADSYRLRAYRIWEIINSDTGNIMLEPKFNYQVLSGSADITAVDGGNAEANWLDIDPDGTAIVAVNYDAINAVGNSSHGGLFPATDPARTAVAVISDKAAGTAMTDISVNGDNSANTRKDIPWDTNYDTWYFTDEQNTMDFNVTATGNVDVDYAFVSTDDSLKSTMSGWKNVKSTDDGYSIPLTEGGSVIIRMSDDSGVSYQVIRVGKVAVEIKNATNEGEPLMAGNKVEISLTGVYRGINKMSGIFNPLSLVATYSFGDTQATVVTGQYYRLVTDFTYEIPKDAEAGTAYVMDQGYINLTGMWSNASPFSVIYNMTDTGVGTNFNAVQVKGTFSKLPDVTYEVSPTVAYDVTFKPVDSSTNEALSDYTLVVKDHNGEVVEAGDDGVYNLAVGTYSYTLSKGTYYTVRDSFTLRSDSENDGGKITFTVPMEFAAADAWDGTAATEPAQVTAEESNTENGEFYGLEGYYKITNGAELAWLAQQTNSGNGALNAIMTKDVNLAKCSWTPIGDASNAYTGTFLGGGHEIKAFMINADDNTGFKALFGSVKGGTIKDITITGEINYAPAGTVARANTGSLIGYLEGSADSNYEIANIVSNVDITVTRTAGNCQNVGGVIGQISGGSINTHVGTITNVVNNGDVTGFQYTAGLFGYIGSSVTIKDCVNNGTITGLNSPTAGIAADVTTYTEGSLENCVNNGTVLAKVGRASGIVDTINGTEVTGCANTGNVTAEASNAAGLIYSATGNTTITNCYNSGSVTSKTANAAGIVAALSGSTVSNSYNSGSVTTSGPSGSAAGIVAYFTSGTITDCYNLGAITSVNYNAGGIVGQAFINSTVLGNITNCYNGGELNGVTEGGIAAEESTVNKNYSLTVTNSYYLEGVEAIGKYKNTLVTLTDVSAKTSEELMTLAPVLGESFKNAKNRYPALTWEDVELPPVTVKVDILAQAEGQFLCGPQKDVEVSSDLAEKYGFTDSVKNGVSALDVLVRAHEIVLGDAFTEETVSDYLTLSNGTMVKTIFGVDTNGANGFTVNDLNPTYGELGTYGYTGYLITEAPISDGDDVNFYTYQDSYYSDNYIWFAQDGVFSDSFTATAGKPIDITVKGYNIAYMGCRYNKVEDAQAIASTLMNAQLVTVNTETGAMTDIKDAITDENGTVSLTFDQVGTYTITAYNVGEYGNPMIMTLATVTVEKGVVRGDANGDGIVDASDARAVLKIAASGEEPTAEQLEALDFNGDGVIDALDAMLIARYAANLD